MICLFIWKLNNLILTSCHFIPEIRKKYSLRINQHSHFRLSYFWLSSPSLWRWRRRPKSRRQSSRRSPLVSETREDIIRHTRTTHIHCTHTTLCRTHTLHTAITVILPIILTTTTIILTTISSKRWNPRWLGINTGTRRTSHGNLITSWKPHYFMKISWKKFCFWITDSETLGYRKCVCIWVLCLFFFPMLIVIIKLHMLHVKEMSFL